MTTITPLLLITADPSHPLAHLALRYTRAYLQSDTNEGEINHAPLHVFFYGDAAHIANRLRWQSADQVNITKEWQSLAEQYKLALPVCVSTALSRGVSDADNSTRHQLDSSNLASGFTLVGLSELAMMMQNDCRLIQF
ncbi:sulfurtransferase complex subunit TusD [Psychrobacter vallis]|uniref:sulfurtransferase complex subunit TusD n=1 Tax=Psychrobacter vallis TaxID=248451 RepID=UPI001918EFC3|nr:sulfurtransferase complex subunit TusD [Psychrobacter vallis]